MKGKSMVSIGMAECNLGVEGAKAVAGLASVTPSLTSLSLGDNPLGDQGIEVLSGGLKESKSLAILDLHNHFVNSEYKFGPKGAAALASAVAVMGSLTSVWTPAHEPSP